MDKTQEEIFTEFKERRKKLIVFLAFFYPSVFACVFLLKIKWLKENIAFLIIPLSLYILVAVFFANKIWRCPSCGHLLGKVWKPKFCPECGIPLINNKEPPTKKSR